MNAPATALPTPGIGQRMPGGFYVGAVVVPDKGTHGLILAPKAALDLGKIEWGPYGKDVPAARSLIDGPENTMAMADHGSDLARRILNFKFEDLQDFYLPAQDELEVIYRNCKPTADENSQYMRSGINLHAWPAPTLPYSHQGPSKTPIELFRDGGPEAFNTEDPYWTSTQHAGDRHYAWSQWFSHGSQSTWYEGLKFRACLVRRFKI